MGKLKWLRDPVTKEKIAPKTSIRAVFDDSGNRLDKLLEEAGSITNGSDIGETVIKFSESDSVELPQNGDKTNSIIGKIYAFMKNGLYFDKDDDEVIETVDRREADILGGMYTADDITNIIDNFDNNVENYIINTYSQKNNIINTTKVINVMNNTIANCAIDGKTDDFEALNAIKTYVNSTTEPVTIVFPYTGKAMLLSNEIHFTRSHITLDIYCDIKFTKTTFAENDNMTVLKFGYSDTSRTPIYDVNVIGHNVTIDANGSATGLVQTKHTQVAQGNGIRFHRVGSGLIRGVHVTNALVDGIFIYVSKNVIVEDCEVSGTIMDNGLTVQGLPLFESDWTFNKCEDRCWNNVIVRNCVSHNNADIGFGASVCHGVTFENCTSYQNGTADGFNAGGGYGAEILFANKMFFEVSLDFDMEITFRNCKALNNNNYAFYTDTNGVTIDNCIVDTTITNNETDADGRNIRGGNGVFSSGTGRLDILNSRFVNVDLWAICINVSSTANVRIEKCSISTCHKGIYVPYVKSLVIKDLNTDSVDTHPIYINDGTAKDYVEIKNVTMNNAVGTYIGAANFADIDGIYLRTKSGVSVALTIAGIQTGILQNVKILKGENTSWLTAMYVAETNGNGLVISDNLLSDANIKITDKRNTTTE